MTTIITDILISITIFATVITIGLIAYKVIKKFFGDDDDPKMWNDDL